MVSYNEHRPKEAILFRGLEMFEPGAFFMRLTVAGLSDDSVITSTLSGPLTLPSPLRGRGDLPKLFLSRP